MKSIMTLCFLLLLGVRGSLADDKQRALLILQDVENRIRQTNSLIYTVECISTQPMSKDSIYQKEGTVWLKRSSKDSIFGCRFHAKGKDNAGAFDYYYDGQDAYEVRHPQKEITVFHPAQYPNDPHNPAKARSALSIFVGLLIDTNITKTLSADLISATVSDEKTSRVLTLKYSPNEYDQRMTRMIYLDSHDPTIAAIKTTNDWRGTTFTETFTIQDFHWNPTVSDDDIVLTQQYAQYQIKEFGGARDVKPVPQINLVGKQAPEFSYPDLVGNIVKLSSFKGKIVVLDFWETWCGWCLLAFPKLKELQNSYLYKDIIVIGVTTENFEKVAKLTTSNDFNYPNILADGAILQQYQIGGRPTYCLINRAGFIEAISIGDLEPVKSKLIELTK